MAKVKNNSPPTPTLTPPPPLPVSCDGAQQVEHKEPSSLASNYKILRDLGEGCFGKVTQSLKLDTKEIVAVKIPKDDDSISVNEKEVSMLKKLRCLDPEKCNIVRFYDCFPLDGQTCLVFEILDISLSDYLKQRKSPLPLNDIRSIIQQMAIAFKALKDIGVIHTDVKLGNIMLVDHVKKPFGVKLIDFGLAILRSEAKPGSILQPLRYRSPEILLGLPFSEAIDMWALGCVMSHFLLCYPLFHGKCEYDVMRVIVSTLGQPVDHLLNAGLTTTSFFRKKTFSFSGQHWRLKSPKRYARETGIVSKDCRCYKFSSLDDLTELNLQKEDSAEVADRREFVNLLKQMLQMDASERITPSEVLIHPFITMSHLTNGSHHSSHGEASPPAITMQRESGIVDERPSQPTSFEPSSSQTQSRSNSTKKRTEAGDCPGRTSRESQPRVTLVMPKPDIPTNQSDGANKEKSNSHQISPQAVVVQVSSSQESLSELAHLAAITECTPSLDTTEVGAPTATPAVDSAIVATTLVPLSSPVAALNNNNLVNTNSAHSTSKVSKPKKKKKGVRRFFSRLMRTLCCCCAPKEEDVE